MADWASGQYRSAAMNQRLAIHTFMRAPGALVDVRSPSEFAKAHWPGAVNLPLFDDEGRAEVGTLYKQQGRQQAIQRGLELVGPKLAAMGQQLQQIAQQEPGGLRIYCWRGGMRSGSVAWLASTLDLEVVALEGGYKSFRRWVLGQFERPWPVQLLGGGTGCGKTDVLHALAQQGGAMVDLEGLAHHRGSSFGGLGQPEQPSTEMFENELAQALVAQEGQAPLWLEAESVQIGRCRLPNGSGSKCNRRLWWCCNGRNRSGLMRWWPSTELKPMQDCLKRPSACNGGLVHNAPKRPLAASEREIWAAPAR